MRVAVIDYGLGNLQSVTQALAHLGAEAGLTEDAAGLAQADALILPGVGAFGDGMAGLAQRGLVAALRAQVQAGKPLLGICLGLQLFFPESEESPGVAGLGFLPGKVVRFQGRAFGATGGLKVPHMGWNQLFFPRPHPLFAAVAQDSFVYFVHSYYPAPQAEADVLAWTTYGLRCCAAAGRANVVGCQFHPEKSQAVGLQILRNFLDWAGKG